MTGSPTRGQPRRSRRILYWVAVPVVALLVAGVATYNTDQGRAWVESITDQTGLTEATNSAEPLVSPSAAATAPPATPAKPAATLPPPVPPEPIPSATASAGPNPTKIDAIWRQGLGAPAVGRHVVAAVTALGDPSGGRDQEFRSGSGSVVPASTMKILTSAAALESLGPDHTFETTVTLDPAADGQRLRSVVLVGGGDPLLTRRPDPADYPVRADLRTLAKEVAAKLATTGVRRVQLRYDTTLFSGPVGSSRWRADYLTDKIVAPITALWVDEGRPVSGFGRVSDPALVAAEEFARALRKAGVLVRGAPQPGSPQQGAAPVGEVSSPPLSQIVEHVLKVSDNEAAEVLAHQVGLVAADEGSFEGGARGVATTLSGLGIPFEGAAIFDGSGLSRANRLTSDTLLAVLRLAAQPDKPHLRSVLTGLPVAGFTGSLTYRFADGPAAGRGMVRAKTGTLTGVHGLAGTVTDRDGQDYAFVIIADRVPLPQQLAARLAIDRLAARLAACRCSS